MKVIYHNVQTGEIIERDATAAEVAQRQADENATLAQKQAEQAIKVKREELLERLGITEEEAKLLLS